MSPRRARMMLVAIVAGLMWSHPVAGHGDEADPSLPHVVDGGPDALPWVAFNITSSHVHYETPLHGLLDIIVIIGEENATEPAEWYIIHVGNDTFAVDQSGLRLNVTGGAFARTGSAPGGCVVVAAEAWERIDHEKHVLARIPSHLPSLADAWGAGTHCHQDVAAPAVEVTAKKSPLGVMVAATALAAVLWMRRR